MEHSFWLTMDDSVEVFIKKWDMPDQKPKAIIQIAHGMVEHIERYKDFANHLVKQGFIVYGNDHRGHGKTGEKQKLHGYFADEQGFTKTTNDLFEITNHIKNQYPTSPIILFGHSMGSFLVRDYIQAYSDRIDGVILSGTGYYPKIVSMLGRSLASLFPPKNESKLMNQLIFSSNNKKIKSPRNEFEWLTRDESVVANYIADPYSGFIPTGRFFFNLLSGLLKIQDKKQNTFIRSDLPMLLISGDADPVGDYGKGIWKTASMYEELGLQNLSVMLFEEARHELLNELNRNEVYEFICSWLDLQLT